MMLIRTPGVTVVRLRSHWPQRTGETPQSDSIFGRVLYIFRDKRDEGSGEIVLALQRVVAFSALQPELQHLQRGSERRLEMEYVLLEDIIDYVKECQILGRVNGYYDRDYQSSDEIAAEAGKKQMSVQERDQRAEKRKLAGDARRQSQGRPAARRRPTQQTTAVPEWNDELGDADLAGYLFYVRCIFNSRQRTIRSFRLRWGCYSCKVTL